MSDRRDDVLITGIGLVSSLGEGVDSHLDKMRAGKAPQPVVDGERFAPYAVHPLPAVDWTTQIPRKDQRQMETWQRLGVYAAGLALSDAGIAPDEELRASIDMIVAAGGGERDPAVDALVMARARGEADPQPIVNEVLSSELRPTLFLAQLSNLLAGNISIVHKVTGSSRTFMGEEGAGISAVQTAAARIAAGQSGVCLVGGAFSAERPDLLLNFELGGILFRDGWRPIAARGGGGLVPGSVGVFLVLESAAHAAARGVVGHAMLRHVASDRGPPDEASTLSRLSELVDPMDGLDRDPLILTGASGVQPATEIETRFLLERFPQAPIRAYGNLMGHGFEAHFLTGLALAAASLSRGAALAPFGDGAERPVGGSFRQALVTLLGHRRGEGIALLETLGQGRDAQ